MGAPFPGTTGAITTLNRSVKQYTFVYAALADTSKWRGTSWKTVKKEFASIDEATTAAGLWMRVCFEHDCPVAVAVQEVK